MTQASFLTGSGSALLRCAQACCGVPRSARQTRQSGAIRRKGRMEELRKDRMQRQHVGVAEIRVNRHLS